MHKQSHTLRKTFGKAKLSADVHHLLADDISSDVNSPGNSHSSSMMVNIYFLTCVDMSPVLPIPIAIFSLSIDCRMRKQSHILGKTIGKAELPVDVPNPLDDDVSGDVNSLAYLAYFHSSSMIVNIYISPTSFMPITTCSFYLSVFCRMRGLSHTLGKTFGKAELCWHSSPPS